MSQLWTGETPPPPDPPSGQPVQPAAQTTAQPTVYVQQRTNGMAVASLVLGIVWIMWIGSVLALVFGYIAKGQIEASNGTESGTGLAVAGIVLGWVGVGFLVLYIILVAAGATNID
jgi:hypothetical protein